MKQPLYWSKRLIIVSEDTVGSKLRDTPKNKSIIWSIHILINRIMDMKNEIDDLEEKLEIE